MALHKPGDSLGLRRVEAEAGAELHCDLGSQQAVVAAPPLGDVVEQHGDVKDPPRDDLMDDRAADGMVALEIAALDPRQ